MPAVPYEVPMTLANAIDAQANKVALVYIGASQPGMPNGAPCHILKASSFAVFACADFPPPYNGPVPVALKDLIVDPGVAPAGIGLSERPATVTVGRPAAPVPPRPAVPRP